MCFRPVPYFKSLSLRHWCIQVLSVTTFADLIDNFEQLFKEERIFRIAHCVHFAYYLLNKYAFEVFLLYIKL